jgi:Tfp pilus assembly protein PilF
MNIIERLEALIAQGKDGAMLRYGLGDAYLRSGDTDKAVVHLRRAVSQDPAYSAAWKLLGRVLVERQADEEAAEAFRQGIAVAEHKGDVQAAKEMQVFLNRIEKRRRQTPDD